jgi:hypothetical protein
LLRKRRFDTDAETVTAEKSTDSGVILSGSQVLQRVGETTDQQQQILAREITDAVAQRRDIGEPSLLERYQRRHMRTTRPMFHGTNEMVKFFTDDRAPAKLARKIALRVANRLPPLKNAIQNKLTETTNRHSLLPPVFRIFARR